MHITKYIECVNIFFIYPSTIHNLVNDTILNRWQPYNFGIYIFLDEVPGCNICLRLLDFPMQRGGIYPFFISFVIP